ncbi:MAG: DUF4287 domain-containing protein [Ilumatobacteraceae bacterium]
MAEKRETGEQATRDRATGERVKGPASYFPSIERTYGEPIEHWLSIVAAMEGAKHSEMVAVLKSEHGMGHGHANAIVAHHRAERAR